MSDQVYQVSYGDGSIEAVLPERTRVVATPAPLPALADPEAAIRAALANPINHEPIHNLVGPGAKVTIAFDDPCTCTPPMRPPDFRAMAIPIVLSELERAGVARADIRLVCANALHRQFTRGELATVLGRDLVLSLPLQRLTCHDAEDRENLVFLGETKRGFEVEVSRLVTDSDLLIYVNVTRTPFSGGWKSIVVGLSSLRSIRHHHRPWPAARGASVMDPEHSAFQKLVWEMGALIEGHLARQGRRIFTIESALNNRVPPELATVHAGHIPDVHVETLKVLMQQQVTPFDGQVDLGVWGLSNRLDPYSQHASINPVLVANLGCSYAFGLYQNAPLVREGGIAIFVHPCDAKFDTLHHPSYVEFFERVLPYTNDPVEAWDTFSEDFAHRPEYLYQYRHCYAFHPVHPFFMLAQTGFARRHLNAIFVAGAKDPAAVRRLGFTPFASLADALREAENRLGQGCRVAYHPLPPASIARVIG